MERITILALAAMRDRDLPPIPYLQYGRDLPLLEHGHPARGLLLLPPLLPVPLVGHDGQRLVQVRRLRLLLSKMLLLMLLLMDKEVLLLMMMMLAVLLLPGRSRQRRADGGRRRRRRHEGHGLALGVGSHQPEEGVAR